MQKYHRRADAHSHQLIVPRRCVCKAAGAAVKYATTQTANLPYPPRQKGAATTSTRSKATIKYTGRAGADSAVYTGYLSFRQEIKDT